MHHNGDDVKNKEDNVYHPGGSGPVQASSLHSILIGHTVRLLEDLLQRTKAMRLVFIPV